MYDIKDAEKIFEMMKNGRPEMSYYSNSSKSKSIKRILSILNKTSYSLPFCTNDDDRKLAKEEGCLSHFCGDCYRCGYQMVWWYAKKLGIEKYWKVWLYDI